jgi:hypothetical protein
MDKIRVVHALSDLKGTVNFEFQIGEYRGRNWVDGSIFIAEEVFYLIEHIFLRHVPEFSHCGFQGIRRSVWEKIIPELYGLDQLARSASRLGEIGPEIGFFNQAASDEFCRDFRNNADALASLARELAGWLKETLKKHECISVLGI